MKMLSLILLGILTFLSPRATDPTAQANFPLKPESLPTRDSVGFEVQILPILKNRCSPCHFPGGTMYKPMPFDQAKTILQHQPGVLKRFNDAVEKQLLEHFFAQRKQ